jgi:hypothetical protein
VGKPNLPADYPKRTKTIPIMGTRLVRPPGSGLSKTGSPTASPLHLQNDGTIVARNTYGSSKQHLVTQDKNENMVQITMLAPRDTRVSLLEYEHEYDGPNGLLVRTHKIDSSNSDGRTIGPHTRSGNPEEDTRKKERNSGQYRF